MEVTNQHLTLPAQTWSLEELRDFCKRTLKASCVDQQIYRQVVLAVDEVAANIVEHAYPKGSKKGDLKLDIDIQDDRVVVEIRDTGVPFNPLSAKCIDPKKSFSARLRRGYGIALIRRIIDDIRYDRTDGGENVLTLTKIVSSQGG